jgi:hypothetical protein
MKTSEVQRLKLEDGVNKGLNTGGLTPREATLFTKISQYIPIRIFASPKLSGKKHKIN